MFVDFAEWNTISKSSQLIKHFLVYFRRSVISNFTTVYAVKVNAVHTNSIAFVNGLIPAVKLNHK